MIFIIPTTKKLVWVIPTDGIEGETNPNEITVVNNAKTAYVYSGLINLTNRTMDEKLVLAEYAREPASFVKVLLMTVPVVIKDIAVK